MGKIIVLILVVTVMFFSCKQSSKSAQETVNTETSNSAENIQDDKDIYTTYKYADSKGGTLIVQNSLPRGGMKYIDPAGEEYYYAVFFTQIINETDNPLELKVTFPADSSYEFPSLPGRYFKLLIPADTITLAKVPLPNYGLKDLENFLNNNRLHPSSLKRKINPKETSGFYVVKLNLKPKSGWEGGSGSTRAEFIIKEQNLYYRIENVNSKSNSKSSAIEINCGNLTLKNLSLIN